MRRSWLLFACALSSWDCEFGSDSGKLAQAPHVATTCAGAPDRLQADYHDDYDCVILETATRRGHPDAMLIKAQIEQESLFNPLSISPDSPCGIHTGWTDQESKSFGLTQITPACGESSDLLKPDGHPNLTTDPASDLWPTSVFNPAANIDAGVGACVGFLSRVKSAWPGCTDAQYNLMSAGAYNSGDGSVLGCGMYNARASEYVSAVLGHYQSFAALAGWPNPY